MKNKITKGTVPELGVISYTKLNLYQLCPFQYKCYVDKSVYHRYHRDTPPLVFGSLIHGVLCSFYKDLLVKERNYQQMRGLFKEKFLANQIKHLQVFKNKQTINQYVAKAKQQFTNFLDSRFAKTKPYLVPEKNQRVTIGNLEFLAKIDRIDKSKQGLEIIDYKTGRLYEPNIDPFQLNFYQLVISQKYPLLPVIQKTYFYLDSGKEISFPTKTNDNKKTLAFVKKIVKQINADKEFKPKINPKCRWCDFRTICPLQRPNSDESPF